MNTSRTVIVTGSLALCAALAFALHPAALFPAPARAHAVPSPLAADRATAHAPPAPPALVYVAGAVMHPGVYAVAVNARAGDALARAGGAKPDADLVAVNLAAHVADGDEIAVPRIGDAPRASRSKNTARRPAGSRPARRRSSPRAVATPQPDRMVDVNTAAEPALAELPGIGPALAARIVAFREANGPFSTVDELADISGITSSRLDKILPYVTVGNAVTAR